MNNFITVIRTGIFSMGLRSYRHKFEVVMIHPGDLKVNYMHQYEVRMSFIVNQHYMNKLPSFFHNDLPP